MGYSGHCFGGPLRRRFGFGLALVDMIRLAKSAMLDLRAGRSAAAAEGEMENRDVHNVPFFFLEKGSAMNFGTSGGRSVWACLAGRLCLNQAC